MQENNEKTYSGNRNLNGSSSSTIQSSSLPISKFQLQATRRDAGLSRVLPCGGCQLRQRG